MFSWDTFFTCFPLCSCNIFIFNLVKADMLLLPSVIRKDSKNQFKHKCLSKFSSDCEREVLYRLDFFYITTSNALKFNRVVYRILRQLAMRVQYVYNFGGGAAAALIHPPRSNVWTCFCGILFLIMNCWFNLGGIQLNWA